MEADAAAALTGLQAELAQAREQLAEQAGMKAELDICRARIAKRCVGRGSNGRVERAGEAEVRRVVRQLDSNCCHCSVTDVPPCRAGAAGAASDAGAAASRAQLRSLEAQLEVTAEAEAEASGRAALQATEIRRLQGELSVPPRLVPLLSLLASAPLVAAFHCAMMCLSLLG